MRRIKPQLTPELSKHIGDQEVWQARPYKVSTYRRLVEQVARLAYINPDHILFFRGQDTDYQSRSGGTTLYPPIYRGDQLERADVQVRFRQLDAMCAALRTRLEETRLEGYTDVLRKRYIQWSILQHYEVAATPLLDITHSLRVACSFAQLANTTDDCFVYVLAMPYATNRIAINSEDDIVNIRLLSICPPSALRPQFQEGYLAGTPDVVVDYTSKTELDFRNRLVAKFKIPGSRRFWGIGFQAMPPRSLYPERDKMKRLCDTIVRTAASSASVGDVGEFLFAWTRLEEGLLARARQLTERNVSVAEAVRVLSAEPGVIASHRPQLEQLRRLRNEILHLPQTTSPEKVAGATRLASQMVETLRLKRGH